MKTQPHLIAHHEMTMKQLWLSSFVALLGRMPPEQAVAGADRALELCNEHWKTPGWVHSWQYKHNYPIGTEFLNSEDPTDEPTI